ncbi:MAG: sensor histidine kinase [Phycisphaerales bacterium JB052]
MSTSATNSRMNLRRYFDRGESLVATTGMAFVAILSFVVGGVIWISARTIDESANTQAEQRVAQTSQLLVSQAEIRLNDGDVAGLRRLLLDSAASAMITSGRVSFPQGGIIASTEPNEITINEIPVLNESSVEIPSSLIADPRIGVTRVSEPLQIFGQHGGVLELEIDQTKAIAGSEMIRASSVGVAAVGLVLTLLVYRRFRFRLGALAAIGESLRQIEQGERRTECLRVGDTLGTEAIAWNTLLAERDEFDRAISEQDIVAVSTSGGGESFGLPSACNVLTQGMVLVDQDLSVLYINGAAAVFLRSMRDQLIGADLTQIEGFDPLIEQVRAALEAEGSVRRVVELGDVDNLESNGSVLKASIMRVEEEGVARAVVFIEDITQQRLSSQSQNAFIAQATHELRTPLTTIRLYCEEAIEADEADEQVREKALNVISSETRRLERIVGDMLCVSEIEAGSLNIRRESMRTEQLFTELEEDYQAQARDKSITLDFDLPPKFPTIQADRDRLGQALHNLMGNAIKYTPSGGTVSVTASFDEHDAMSVSITDTGIGIDESQQERIFERFTRADDRRIAKVTGSGLGLALARQIARLHGGDITLESEIDQGSTFTLFVPGTTESKQAA